MRRSSPCTESAPAALLMNDYPRIVLQHEAFGLS